MKCVFYSVALNFFIRVTQTVRIHSIDQVSYGVMLMFWWVARITWDNSASRGGVSIYIYKRKGSHFLFVL